MLEQIPNNCITDTFFNGNEVITIELHDKKQYTYTILRVQHDEVNDLFEILSWCKIANNVELITVGHFNLATKSFIPAKRYQNKTSYLWPRNLRTISYVLEKLNKLNSKFKIYRGAPDDD